MKTLLQSYILFLIILLTGCSDSPWNNPYPVEQTGNILFTAFSERPKHLDPARSYSSDENILLGQIYEPPLQYHYLKRPYQLEPLLAQKMPEIRYFNKAGKEVSEDSGMVEFTEYVIDIRQGIKYQPHPAFVRDEKGNQRYLNLHDDDVKNIYEISDFSETDTRELTAADYVYQIKRLAHPDLHSPILGLMSEYIVGLAELAAELKQEKSRLKKNDWMDLRQYKLAGVELLDQYRYSIRLKSRYPQFKFWLSMSFFAPMPFEVERFYQQSSLIAKNITLDWFPVGTGAYYLARNNPNKQMVLQRNPNFHGAVYPSEGMPEDYANGLLDDAGKPLPFIDRIVFSLEKESIPYWNKFLQGYYDNSGISSDSFDQAIQVGSGGNIDITDEMKDKGIRLSTTVAPSIFYFGFNMRDEVVGGLSDRGSKLRRAIAIAVDYEEFISIFLNGRGLPAHSPIPPGIFGYLEDDRDFNNEVYEKIDGRVRRRSIEQAQKLLSEAGYENGIDPKTGKKLILYLDTTGSGPDSKSRLAWWRKQFDKLNIQLVIRNTDYNRFRSKVSKGTAQMYQWGWNADYPDPENFMFLLYGPNSKVTSQGENASNYSNPQFDRLFEKMKDMQNGPERQQIISDMIRILRHDSPWLWGLFSKSFSLHHAWYFNAKPNAMSANTLMYKRIDPQLRHDLQKQWNRPIWWPLVLILLTLVLSLIPAWRGWRRKENEIQLKIPVEKV